MRFIDPPINRFYTLKTKIKTLWKTWSTVEPEPQLRSPVFCSLCLPGQPEDSGGPRLLSLRWCQRVPRIHADSSYLEAVLPQGIGCSRRWITEGTFHGSIHLKWAEGHRLPLATDQQCAPIGQRIQVTSTQSSGYLPSNQAFRCPPDSRSCVVRNFKIFTRYNPKISKKLNPYSQ